MRTHFARCIPILAGAVLLIALPLTAQDKAAPKVLALTSSSEAAKAALASAVDEIQNIGGARRYDARLKSAVDADPAFAVGRAYYAHWASGLTNVERMQHLDRALKDAVAASTPELLVVTAVRELRAGRAPVARDLLDMLLKHTPDDAGVHFLRLLFAANVADGIEVGQRVVQRFPDFGPAYNILAYRLNTVGRHAEALDAVRKYAELVPNHPNSHDSYAEILSLQGKLDESDAHYRRAIELDPGYEVGYEGLAENTFRRGDYVGARAHVEKALSLAEMPGRRIALMRELAALYALDRKLKEAKQQLTAAIQVAEAAALPASAEADHRNLALLAAVQGKRAEALQHYQAAQPSTPAPFSPVGDGIFYLLLGDDAEVAKAEARITRSSAGLDGQTAADAQHILQVFAAVAKKDLAAARKHHDALEGPVFRAYSGAFIKKLDDVESFKELSMNGALVRLIAKKK